MIPDKLNLLLTNNSWKKEKQSIHYLQISCHMAMVENNKKYYKKKMEKNYIWLVGLKHILYGTNRK